MSVEPHMVLTRAQRLEAAQAAWSDPDSGADGLAAALDAALADLGGLDGLERLDWRDRERRKVGEDWRELRADRDRLRGALMFAARGDDSNSTASKAWLAARLRSVAERAREALRDSEAGT